MANFASTHRVAAIVQLWMAKIHRRAPHTNRLYHDGEQDSTGEWSPCSLYFVFRKTKGESRRTKGESRQTKSESRQTKSENRKTKNENPKNDTVGEFRQQTAKVANLPNRRISPHANVAMHCEQDGRRSPDANITNICVFSTAPLAHINYTIVPTRSRQRMAIACLLEAI